LDGNYAFVAVRGEWQDKPGHLRVVNISDPVNPVEAGNYDLPTYWPVAIAVHDNNIYVTSSTGIYVYEFSSSTISGKVIDIHNNPIKNVNIEMSTGFSIKTSMDGTYVTPELPSGTYTLTPLLSGYVFYPPARVVNVPPPEVNQDFIILSPPVTTTLQPFTSSRLLFTDTQGLPTNLFFPTGTVSLTTNIEYEPLGKLPPPTGNAFAAHAFDLKASRDGNILSELTFSKPVSVTIEYSAEDVRVISDTQGLGLWWRDGGEWQAASQSCENPGGTSHILGDRMISTPVCKTGQYALFGPTYEAFLPIVGNGKLLP
jgi:hypothetical protein